MTNETLSRWALRDKVIQRTPISREEWMEACKAYARLIKQHPIIAGGCIRTYYGDTLLDNVMSGNISSMVELAGLAMME